MRGFWGDRRGVTVQIGAILLFGILILALASYQAVGVPAENEQVEFNHNLQVQQDMLELRGSLLQTSGGEQGQSTAVRLGTTYPSRLLLVNPPPASGSLRTGPTRNVTFQNLSATDGEADQFLNTTQTGPYNLSTRPVTYRPAYNVYDSAPDTSFQSGTVVNEAPRGNDTAISSQNLVEGSEITLVAVTGNLSVARSGAATIDPRAVSAATRTVPVRSDGTGNLTLIVPTTLSADRWQRLLDDEYDPDFDGDGHVYRVADVPGRDAVRLSLDGGVTYRLRTALVGVGSVGTAPPPAYVTATKTADGVTVEVRDRFNNPVPNSRTSANLTVTSNSTALLPAEQTVGEDGKAEFDYGGSGGTVELTLVNENGAPVLDATNGTVVVDVASADTPPDTGVTLGGVSTYSPSSKTFTLASPGGKLEGVSTTGRLLVSNAEPGLDPNEPYVAVVQSRLVFENDAGERRTLELLIQQNTDGSFKNKVVSIWEPGQGQLSNTLTEAAANDILAGSSVDLLNPNNYDSTQNLGEIRTLDDSTPVQLLVQDQVGRYDITFEESNAIVIDSFTVNDTDNGRNIDPEATATVSDRDGDDDLSELRFVLRDADGNELETDVRSISGGTATETVSFQSFGKGKGSYTVTVTAVDDDGNVATDTKPVPDRQGGGSNSNQGNA